MHGLGVIQRMNQEALDSHASLCETGNTQATSKGDSMMNELSDFQKGDKVISLENEVGVEEGSLGVVEHILPPYVQVTWELEGTGPRGYTMRPDEMDLVEEREVTSRDGFTIGDKVQFIREERLGAAVKGMVGTVVKFSLFIIVDFGDLVFVYCKADEIKKIELPTEQPLAEWEQELWDRQLDTEEETDLRAEAEEHNGISVGDSVVITSEHRFGTSEKVTRITPNDPRQTYELEGGEWFPYEDIERMPDLHPDGLATPEIVGMIVLENVARTGRDMGADSALIRQSARDSRAKVFALFTSIQDKAYDAGKIDGKMEALREAHNYFGDMIGE